ncbi:BREX system ATP-binding domain-containing protein [Actinomycetospora sp.]|uniref:BREX system ATP-binding domain-containing protein n=1 Tax=Actinomycetospora sp. TaxID=1872135 RepID=UPI002F41C371
MSVALRLLGPLELVGCTGTVRLGGAKERCLLTALAIRAGEVVSEDRLVDALWEDVPPRTATKTLQNHVLRLRRLVAGCDATIITRPPGYLLEIGSTDGALAETLIAEARRAADRDDHTAALAGNDEALTLWRGPALAEFAERPFARDEAARLDELRETANDGRIASLLGLGRNGEAILAGEALVNSRPLRERRWIQLMLALYRAGRQAEALECYRRMRLVLADQLGVDPGPEARRLESAILAQDPSLTLPPAAPTTRTSAGATPCFGRDRELGALLGQVDTAAAGRGGVALVRGDAGVGKTHLLAELAERARARGAHVLSGRCIEGAGAAPFQPFAEALEAHFDGTDVPPAVAALEMLLIRTRRTPSTEPGPALQPDEVRLRLLDGVARFVADLARTAAVVLLLDDLHWADDGTVAMVRHAARSTVKHRVLVVGAFRDGEIGEAHPLSDALGALRSDAECTTLRLAGIDRHAVEGLLSATVGAPVADDVVAAVSDETGGNPFFAREIVRQLHEDGQLAPGADGRLRTELPLSAVPDGVREVISRRRRRLTAAANRLLDAASAIDGPFPFDPIRQVARLVDDEGLSALDDVLAAGLAVADTVPDRYTFTHALIRHAVYRELNPSRRLRLHRDVAAALADARADGAVVGAAEIAVQYHRAAALPAAQAGAPFALEAADRAAAAGAHDEQAAMLELAVDLMSPDDPRRAAALRRRATALAWAMRFDLAVESAKIAAADGPRPAVLAEVAGVLAMAGSGRHARLLAADGLRHIHHPDSEDRISWATLTLLDLDRREAADPQHPGMPLDVPGRREALRVLHESGRLAGRGDLARYALAAVHGRRERVPPGAAEDPTVAAFLLGDYDGAVPVFHRFADAAEARGQLAWAVYCRAGQARCQIALGELTAGTESLERVRELVARVPDLERGWQLLHHQGAEDALVMTLDDGWSRRRAEFAPWLRSGQDRHWGSAAITSIGARIEARMGNTESAMSLLAAPVRALRAAPAWAPNYCRMACEVAETLWLLDRRDHLAVVRTALRDKALPADFRFPMTDGRLAMARLCVLSGDLDQAFGWFDAARAVLDAQGARPLRAVVDHDQALAHLRAGEPQMAAPYVSAASAAFEQLGMPGWTRRLACAAGLRPARG